MKRPEIPLLISLAVLVCPLNAERVPVFEARFIRNDIRRQSVRDGNKRPVARSIRSLAFAEGEAPVIDGKLGDSGWKDKRRYMGVYVSETGQKPVSRTEAWLGHTNDELLFAIRCADEAIDKLKINTKPETRDNIKLWAEDGVELFFDTNNDQRSYLQVMINSVGAITDSASHMDGGFRDGMKYNACIRVATSKGKDFWAVEGAIKLADLGIKNPDQAGSMGFNLTRAKYTPEPDYTFWSPGGNYKNPSRFGKLAFPGAELSVEGLDPGEVLVGENWFQATVSNPTAADQAVQVGISFEPNGQWQYVDGKNQIVYEPAQELLLKTISVKAGERRVIRFPYQLPTEHGRSEVKFHSRIQLIRKDGGKQLLQGSSRTVWVPEPIRFFWERSRCYDFEPRLRGIVRVNMDAAAVKGAGIFFQLMKGKKSVLKESSGPLNGDMRAWVFDIRMQAVRRGDYVGRVSVVSRDGKTLAEASAPVSVEKSPKEFERIRRLRVPIVIQDAVEGEKKEWPVTIGVPFPRGTLPGVAANSLFARFRKSGKQAACRKDVRVVDAAGNEIPSQAIPAAHWTEGGSIRWLHLDIQPSWNNASRPKEKPTTAEAVPPKYFLEFGSRVKRKKFEGIVVSETDKTITINTGPLKSELDKKSGQLIDRAWLNGKPILEGGFYHYLFDNSGEMFTSHAPGAETETTIEVNGPLRTVVCRKGWYGKGDKRFCRTISRLHFFKGKSFVKLVHTFIFTEDSNQVWPKDYGIALRPKLQRDQTVTFGSSNGKPVNSELAEGQSVFMLQDAFKHFGQPRNHFTIGKASWRQAASSLSAPDPTSWQLVATLKEGEVAGNWFGISDRMRGVSAVVRDLPRLFPKELEASPGRMRIHLWSNRGGREMDFRTSSLAKFWGEEYVRKYPKVLGDRNQAKGMARSHDLFFYFNESKQHAAGGDSDFAAKSEQVGRLADTPILAMADPKWSCASGAAGRIRHRDVETFPGEEAILDRQIDKVLHTVEDWDNGFFDYGAGPHMGYEDRPNHEVYATTYRYTNQDYNFHYGLWLDYIRSGDRRFFKHIERYTRYRGDVTVSHVDAPDKIIGSHSRGTLVHWGGPRSESIRRTYFSKADNADSHLFYYYLTGDRRGLEIAEDIAAGALKIHSHIGFVRDYAEHRWHERDTFAAMREFLALYRATHNPRLLMQADDAALHLLDLSKAAGVLTRKFQGGGSLKVPTVSHEWAKIEAMNQLYEFSRRHEVLESVKRLIRFRAQRAEGFYCFHYGGRSLYHFAYGYYYTKDPTYIALIQHAIRNGLKTPGYPGGAYANQYRPERKVLWGSSDMASWTIDFPYGMAALANYEGKAPVFPFSPSGAGNEFAFVKKEGEAIEFGVFGRSALEPVRLFDAKGSEVREAQFEKYPYQYPYYTVRIPAELDGGVYTLSAASTFAITFPSDTLHLAVRNIENGLAVDSVRGDAKWYFKVPDNAKRFALDSGQPREVFLFDPDGKRVQPHFDKVNGFIMDVPPQHAGKLWALQANPDSYRKGGRIRLVGVHPWAAYGDPSRFFLPDEKPAKPYKPYAGYDRTKKFMNGVSGREGDRALQVGGRIFDIPAGKPLGNGRYENFDCNEGTVELWIYSHMAISAQAQGPWLVPLLRTTPPVKDEHFLRELRVLGPDQSFQLDNGRSIKGKRVDLGGRARVLQQGEWCHLVFEWKKVGDKLERTLLANGKLVKSVPRDHAGTLLLGERFTLASGSFLGAIDELRISNIRRYNGKEYSLEKAKRFETDKNTLLLFHFDGTEKTEDGRSAESR